MPIVYLSPSLQDYHPYVIGTGNEEYYMNLITDSMIPELRKQGISYIRNNPFDTLPEIISRSNRAEPDLHLALHSNTAPENLCGLLQGPDVYYSSSSQKGQKAAEIFAKDLRRIYPDPALTAVIPNSTLAELRETKAPAVLIELAYHDNEADAQWLIQNIKKIAHTLVRSLSEYLQPGYPSHSTSNTSPFL